MTDPVAFRIVFFTADPHALARFWAAALGYVLGDNQARTQPAG